MKKLASILILSICVVYLNYFLSAKVPVETAMAIDRSRDYSTVLRDIDAQNKELYIWDKRPEVGINVYATSHIGELDLTKAAGMRIVRTSFNWATMENETTKDNRPYNAAWGVYNQSYLADWQNRVTWAKERGLKLSVLVAGRPEGLTYENREEGYKRYASFMGDMAKRYPDVLSWELFNEMDHPGWTPLFGAENNIPMIDRGKLYAQMLKLAYPAIKTANPKAIIATGGLTTLNNAGFTEGIYQEGGKDFFDVMNIHTYGMPAESAMRNEGTRVRNVMNKYGDNGKPLWNTEYGLSAGVTVSYWGYPRTWSDPSNLGGDSPLNQDPPQCRWADLPKDPTGHLLYDGDGFDYMHCKQWRLSLNYAKESRLYQKVFPYSLSALNELDASQAVLQKSDKSNDDIHDYGFGAMRNPPQLLLTRPTYEWLKAAKINQAIISEPDFTTDVLVNNISGFVPQGYAFNYSAGDLIIKDVALNSILPTTIKLTKNVSNNLPLIKTVDKTTAHRGDVITYNLSFINSTFTTMKNIKITDSLPSGTIYVSGSVTENGTYNSSTKQFIWNIDNLPSGIKKTVSFKVRVE